MSTDTIHVSVSHATRWFDHVGDVLVPVDRRHPPRLIVAWDPATCMATVNVPWSEHPGECDIRPATAATATDPGPVVTTSRLPPGEIHAVSATGELLGKIVNAAVGAAPATAESCPRCGKPGGVRCGTSAHGGVHGCSRCFDGSYPLCVDRSCPNVHPLGETCDDARRRIDGSTCPACHAPATSERDGLPVCGNVACRGFGWAHRYIAPTAPRLMDVELCDPSSHEVDWVVHSPPLCDCGASFAGSGALHDPDCRAMRLEATATNWIRRCPISRIAHIPRHRPGPMVRIEPEDWP